MGRRKKDEAELYKPIRFTARPEIVELLDRVPKGLRSEVINAAIKQAYDRAVADVIKKKRAKLQLEEAATLKLLQALEAIEE